MLLELIVTFAIVAAFCCLSFYLIYYFSFTCTFCISLVLSCKQVLLVATKLAVEAAAAAVADGDGEEGNGSNGELFCEFILLLLLVILLVFVNTSMEAI